MKKYTDTLTRREIIRTGAVAAAVMTFAVGESEALDDAITLKPHHYIALFRDLGDGSDPGRYTNGNDYKPAYDRVMASHRLKVTVTLGLDFICGPCNFLKNGKCTATISGHGPEQPLHDWAHFVDSRLLKTLGLKDGDTLSSRALAERCREKIGRLDMVFSEEAEEKRVIRALSTHVGLNYYLSKDSLAASRLLM